MNIKWPSYYILKQVLIDLCYIYKFFYDFIIFGSVCILFNSNRYYLCQPRFVVSGESYLKRFDCVYIDSDFDLLIICSLSRAAAMRCRERKKAWVAELGRRAECMSATNRALVQEVKLLRAEVARLKALLLTHKDCPVTLAANAGLLPSHHQAVPGKD